jgi:hypothetical protein
MSSGVGEAVEAVDDGVVVDGSCVANDDWLYDQPNFEGNRLCLAWDWNFPYNEGGLSLMHVGYDCILGGLSCRGSWSGRVQSLWGGEFKHSYEWSTGNGFYCDWLPSANQWYDPLQAVSPIPPGPPATCTHGEVMFVLMTNR